MGSDGTGINSESLLYYTQDIYLYRDLVYDDDFLHKIQWGTGFLSQRCGLTIVCISLLRNSSHDPPIFDSDMSRQYANILWKIFKGALLKKA